MRVAYSILREFCNQDYLPTGKDYGLTNRELELYFLLENQGYLKRVLRSNDNFSLKPARLTIKGKSLLEKLSYYEETYPLDRKDLLTWILIEKEMYSNDVNDE